MDKKPKVFEVKARGVGMQVWNVLLNRRRKSFAGSQCGGNAGSKADSSVHGIVSAGVVIND